MVHFALEVRFIGRKLQMGHEMDGSDPMTCKLNRQLKPIKMAVDIYVPHDILAVVQEKKRSTHREHYQLFSSFFSPVTLIPKRSNWGDKLDLGIPLGDKEWWVPHSQIDPPAGTTYLAERWTARDLERRKRGDYEWKLMVFTARVEQQSREVP